MLFDEAVATKWFVSSKFYFDATFIATHYTYSVELTASDMIILLLVSFPILIKSHIVWTYPPARYIPIDFLDKSRTESPCGVPRPQNPVYTDFTVGQALNVTWRMAFPHKGGYRIKLLNSAGEILETIVPENDTGFSHHNDETVENSYIVFNKPCEHCTLLLERQALEWGESYLFHTCADINVIPMMESVEEQCSGRGTWRQGKCHCRHLYSGNVCQYKSDCREDDECLNNGKCVTDLGSMSSKTCYCSFGYFGRNCDRKYEESPTNDECFNYNYPTNESAYAQYGLFNAKCFKKHTLTNDDVVYSRVIGSDVEIILDYKSNSWIALGWRPTQIDRSCRLFPDLEHVRWKRETNGNSPHRMPTEIPTKRTTEPTLAPVKSPELPKNNGFFESALLAPLHAMDCTDIVVGSVEDGRSRINDMYTRDRSTPLRDVWFVHRFNFTHYQFFSIQAVIINCFWIGGSKTPSNSPIFYFRGILLHQSDTE
ncbi:hypothetical protein AB6A40_000754 [Gnathostoma spinigerum]|uniref:EGF-like domain-containing protein n=1 Tax=Gnathostoma spinigerum TaxID=75299 RepID=A0ABD6E2P4_9BILA